MNESYEVEIRRYVGSSYTVLETKIFDDFQRARLWMRHYNDLLRSDKRTEACGPWPIITFVQETSCPRKDSESADGKSLHVADDPRAIAAELVSVIGNAIGLLESAQERLRKATC